MYHHNFLVQYCTLLNQSIKMAKRCHQYDNDTRTGLVSLGGLAQSARRYSMGSVSSTGSALSPRVSPMDSSNSSLRSQGSSNSSNRSEDGSSPRQFGVRRLPQRSRTFTASPVKEQDNEPAAGRGRMLPRRSLSQRFDRDKIRNMILDEDVESSS